MSEQTTENERIDLLEKLLAAGRRDYKKLDLADMAKITRTPKHHIENHFRNTDEWIDGFYCHLVDQYHEMIRNVPDFEKYTAGEKMANFCLTSMDMMREHEELVFCTYHPFILNRFTSTRYEHSVYELFKNFTTADNRIATSNQLLLFSPVYTCWTREYLHMIGYWIEHPDSENQMMALIEKTTDLLDDILYYGALDKAADLTKYLYNNGFLSVTTPFSLVRRFLRF